MIKQLTELEYPDAVVRGSNFARGGDISHHEWCRREVLRLRAKGIHAEAITFRGKVAVYTADNEEEMESARRALR